MTTTDDLFTDSPEQAQKPSGPVTCLGMTFENDEARRAHFTEELRNKLQDPEFRKIEGFPIGSDEDILNLSDPPYYTACPNPWIADFITEWETQRPEQPEGHHYHREPFAEDILGSKYVPLYKLHSYHTKVPYPILMQFMLHYTEPGDVVFDGFSGAGMTGLAAKMLLAPPFELKQEFESLPNSKQFKWGKRHLIQSELSPAASFISSNYMTPRNAAEASIALKGALKDLKESSIEKYRLRLPNDSGVVRYIVWSEHVICDSCGADFSLWEGTVTYRIGNKIGSVADHICCPACGNKAKKRSADKAYHSYYDPIVEEVVRTAKYSPVLVNYESDAGGVREVIPDHELAADLFGRFGLYNKGDFPRQKIPFTHQTHERNNIKESHGFEYIHQFFQPTTLSVFNAWKEIAEQSKHKNFLKWVLTASFNRLTRLVRYMPQHKERNVGPLSGTMYLPGVFGEINPIDVIERKINGILKDIDYFMGGRVVVNSTQSTTDMRAIPNDSVDYIFTDPPFGGNIMYSDLNMLWESWLGVRGSTVEEAIVNTAQKKGFDEYKGLISRCFKEMYRILKPGRWITVEFSNTQAAIWNVIQTTLQEAGFIVSPPQKNLWVVSGTGNVPSA